MFIVSVFRFSLFRVDMVEPHLLKLSLRRMKLLVLALLLLVEELEHVQSMIQHRRIRSDGLLLMAAFLLQLPHSQLKKYEILLASPSGVAKIKRY
jgi:hypothetical protein